MLALSVLRHCPHIFEVDGRKYKIALSFPWQTSVHPNKVILKMSVTIDCSQLPQGKETVKTLSKKFPGLHVHFLRQQRQCSLHGLYSEVQSVVSHLVELLGDHDPPEENSSSYRRDRNQGSWTNQGNLKDQEARPTDQTHGLHVGWLNLNDQRILSSEILMWKNPSKEGTNVDLSMAQTHGTEKRKEWTEELGVEALSLIVEADVFAYLRTRSSKEYENILDRHGVHVVDVTSEGVTTLYLQSDAKAKTSSEIQKCMKQAREELSQIYHQLEGNLRRAQIRRSTLSLRGGDTAAFEDLQSLLPKVLISYDQTYVYIVGQSSEVSRAKQILLLGSRDDHWLSLTPKNEMYCPTSPSNSDSPVSQPETTQAGGASGVLRTVVPKVNNSGVEQRGRGREEYKLAARFKKSEKGFLGFSPGESRRARELQDLIPDMNMLTLTSNSEPTPPSRSSLRTAGTGNDEKASVSQIGVLGPVGASHTGDDILYHKMSHQTFPNSFKTCESLANKFSRTCSTRSTSTLTPAVKAPPSTSVNALSDLEKQAKPHVLATLSNPHPSLKRANSFSGRPSQKQEMQKSGIKKSSHYLRRPRYSSFKSAEQADEHSHGVVSSDILVSAVMWNYMKEAYQSRLAALISDLQVSESPASKGEVRVNLKGSEVSKVGNSQSELQKLVGMIASDFCVQELRMSDLGVTEGSEVFKACCSNIRSQFSKISLHTVKDGVFLTGPKMLCSHASEMLKEVFPNVVSNSAPQTNTFSHQGTTDQCIASDNETLFQSNGHIRPSQIKADIEADIECHEGSRSDSQSQLWNVRPGIQSPKQNQVIRKKFKKGGSADLEAEKTDVLLNKSSVGSSSSTSFTTQTKQKVTQTNSKPSTLPAGNHSEPCVCGERGTRTSCNLVPRSCYLPLHARCMVCPTVKITGEPSQDMWVDRIKEAHTAERLTGKEAGKGPTQVQGIHGTMKCVELPQSLSGYEPYRTAKITYYIPDGIQGAEHPNPGSPFQGGIFDTYLPLSTKGQGLLRCLEKAFKQGLTFTICPGDMKGYRSARIVWDRIPHKMNMEGGRSRNGYPDSTYLNDLAEALKASRIEEAILNEN
ncbi:uncharacterized protein si:busm1-163l24.3 isoform X2 [Electrophorus electricus]|uniref:uncharacterized protein si:busm1-163l24.3 isoform X2 n=1 Tax=Electrophorus electricus TaxID=8005 RepID=UPI0015D0A0A0|nr:uncharacterized protein si:busm1-163l24.3 isoform X2 [Electrophorus electricus]